MERKWRKCVNIQDDNHCTRRHRRPVQAIIDLRGEREIEREGERERERDVGIREGKTCK